jgi:hypothetical protein
MVTLLTVIAILGQSFDVAPQEVEVDVQTMERVTLYLKKDATAEIASDVELEPVHDSTKWFEFSCAKVERTACDDSTQAETYFK